MIIMIMGNDNSINMRDVINLTWNLSESLGAQPAEWRAAWSEDRIEKDAEAAGKLDKEARMAEPGNAK